ncbi:PREDICTED: histone-lysine N-methyltransferase 2C-like isoform X2 [Diuraphis noxia]|uniref:histone-lysine N-methyltransferase 2C-like isoform X2 n=1 Tax=Diuraphis noxia TaxID=143948 RepID=UPI000763AD9B|nr:PREDICTED: histone-lysine N-methyltransferase 2C-like isoform X2 [Diuraphis noxia]
MPNNKSITHEEPIPERLHRNTNYRKKRNSTIPKSVEMNTVAEETLETCYLCSAVSEMTDQFDCPICFTKVHKHCLLVDEPVWKYKLDDGPWFCKECRKQYCNICLNNESQSKIDRRCITCDVGSHTNCYESYDIKTMQCLQKDIYVCTPCMTLATQINSEEEEEEEEEEEAKYDNIEDDVEPKPDTSSIVYGSSNKNDNDSERS